MERHLPRAEQLHRSDSIQGTDYITTPIQGFLGQKLKIYNDQSVEILFH